MSGWQSQQGDPRQQRPATPPQWQQGAPQQPYGQPQYRQPYAAPPQWQPPRRRSWPRRHWLLTSFLAAALIVVIAIAAAANSKKGPDTSALAACTSHHDVSSRQWLAIAKDPDAAKGQCITVYGEVTQFDSATGDATFRAQAGGVSAEPQFGFVDYPTNALFDGDAGALGVLVQDDLFTAQVTVAGSQTYDTQIGGQTTVPVFRVDSVTRTGHLGG